MIPVDVASEEGAIEKVKSKEKSKTARLEKCANRIFMQSLVVLGTLFASTSAGAHWEMMEKWVHEGKETSG